MMSSGSVRKAAGERAAAGVCRCSQQPQNCQAARLAIPGENQGDYTKVYLYPLFLKKMAEIFKIVQNHTVMLF